MKEPEEELIREREIRLREWTERGEKK